MIVDADILPDRLGIYTGLLFLAESFVAFIRFLYAGALLLITW